MRHFGSPSMTRAYHFSKSPSFGFFSFNLHLRSTTPSKSMENTTAFPFFDPTSVNLVEVESGTVVRIAGFIDVPRLIDSQSLPKLNE